MGKTDLLSRGGYIHGWPSPQCWTDRQKPGVPLGTAARQSTGAEPVWEVWPEQPLAKKGRVSRINKYLTMKSDCIQKKPEQKLDGVLTFS